MSDPLGKLGITEGDETPLREILAPEKGDDYITSYYAILRAIEQSTVYTAETQAELPDEAEVDWPLVGIAETETEEFAGDSVHIYDGFEWTDTFQSINAFVQQLDDKIDNLGIDDIENLRNELNRVDGRIDDNSGDIGNVDGDKSLQEQIDGIDQQIEYSREFNGYEGSQTDNSDKIIADGYWFSDGIGYSHHGSWVHDNKPLEPGETRTYTYKEFGEVLHSASDPSDMGLNGGLRTNEHTNRRNSPDIISGETYGKRITRDIVNSGRFAITVEYTPDGSEFHAYSAEDDVTTWDVSSHGDLYFSTYAWYDPRRAESIRLTGIGSSVSPAASGNGLAPRVKSLESEMDNRSDYDLSDIRITTRHAATYGTGSSGSTYTNSYTFDCEEEIFNFNKLVSASLSCIPGSSAPDMCGGKIDSVNTWSNTVDFTLGVARGEVEGHLTIVYV